MKDPELTASAGKPALTGLERGLLHELKVTNAILELIRKDLRGERIDVTYPQLTRMFDAQIPRNAALIAKARA